MPPKDSEDTVQEKLRETEALEAKLKRSIDVDQRKTRSPEVLSSIASTKRLLASARSKLSRLRNGETCRAREREASASRRKRARTASSPAGAATTSAGHNPSTPPGCRASVIREDFPKFAAEVGACLEAWDGSVSQDALDIR